MCREADTFCDAARMDDSLLLPKIKSTSAPAGRSSRHAHNHALASDQSQVRAWAAAAAAQIFRRGRAPTHSMAQPKAEGGPRDFGMQNRGPCCILICRMYPGRRRRCDGLDLAFEKKLHKGGMVQESSGSSSGLVTLLDLVDHWTP